MPPWAARLMASIDERIEKVESALEFGRLPEAGTSTRSLEQPQDAVVQIASNLASQLAGTAPPPPSASLPIIDRVPVAVKNKIWAGEYVEISKLVQDVEDQGGEIAFQFSGQAQGSTVRLINNQPKAKPLNLYQWIMGWNRFSAILIAQSPQLAQGLALHLENILHLAEKKADWKAYDADFRKLVAVGRQSWDATNMELFIRAYMARADTPARGTAPTRMQVPHGCCVRYHTQGKCEAGLTCKYQHRCFRCPRMHPAKDCRATPGAPPRILQAFKPDTPFRAGPKASANTGARAASFGQKQ